PHCYVGTGATRCLSPAPPEMAAPAFAFTITAPPKSSAEDEQLLWDLADEMDPEDGLPLDPWHRGSADHRLHARRNGISEGAARGAQTGHPRGPERTVTEKLGHSACSQPTCAGKDWCITHPIGQR